MLLKEGESGPVLDDDEPVVLVPEVRGGSSYGTPGQPEPKRPRPDSAKRGMAGADTDGLGLMQSYYKKVTLVESKFKGTPFEKVKGLLGSKTGVAGEQGGKMLGSYLYSIAISPTMREELFSTGESVDDFLNAQLQVPNPQLLCLNSQALRPHPSGSPIVCAGIPQQAMGTRGDQLCHWLGGQVGGARCQGG